MKKYSKAKLKKMKKDDLIEMYLTSELQVNTLNNLTDILAAEIHFLKHRGLIARILDKQWKI